MESSIPAHEPLAVVRHEQGVAILQAAAGRWRYAVSPDGLRWTTRTLTGPEGPLWPVSVDGGSTPAPLCCADAEGRFVAVRAGEDRLTVEQSFGAIPGAEPWYEGAPHPADLALVRDESQGVWRGYFSARRKIGRDAERRGCVGAAASPDLRAWRLEPPIFSPNRFPHLFTPHVLAEGGRAALFYSTPESGEMRAIRFALAPHLDGPFERLEPDLLACDARRSLHTVALRGERLVFFGRHGANGASVSRPGQLAFHADGRPYVRFCDALLGLLGKTLFQTQAALASGETLVRLFPRYAGDFRLSLRVRSAGARALGAIFRTSMTGHDNVTVALDHAAGAVVARRGVNGRLLARVPRALHPDESYRLTIWVEGPFADIFVDDEWALTVEAEGRKSGGFGLTVTGGEAQFEEITVQTLAAE